MDGRHFFLFAAMSDPLFFPIFSFGYNLGVGLSVGSDPNFFCPDRLCICLPLIDTKLWKEWKLPMLHAQHYTLLRRTTQPMLGRQPASFC